MILPRSLPAAASTACRTAGSVECEACFHSCSRTAGNSRRKSQQSGTKVENSRSNCTGNATCNTWKSGL